jgi:hypothetical protein
MHDERAARLGSAVVDKYTRSPQYNSPHREEDHTTRKTMNIVHVANDHQDILAQQEAQRDRDLRSAIEQKRNICSHKSHKTVSEHDLDADYSDSDLDDDISPIQKLNEQKASFERYLPSPSSPEKHSNEIEDSQSSEDDFFEDVRQPAPALLAGSDMNRLQMYISSVLILYENTQKLMRHLHSSKTNADKKIDQLYHEVDILNAKVKEQNEHLQLLDVSRNRSEQLNSLRGKLLSDKTAQLDEMHSRYKQILGDKEKLEKDIANIKRMEELKN